MNTLPGKPIVDVSRYKSKTYLCVYRMCAKRFAPRGARLWLSQHSNALNYKSYGHMQVLEGFLPSGAGYTVKPYATRPARSTPLTDVQQKFTDEIWSWFL
jgi:hypothetical protein